MKLNFTPVTNRIGDDYYIVPKDDSSECRCAIKCSEGAAFIINLLVVNHNRDQMIAATAAQYPNLTMAEVEEAVDNVRTALKNSVQTSNSGGESNEG